MITRKSKFLSAMLSVCMTFSAVPAVYAAGDGAGTSDIDGHWAKTALEEFIKDGYLNGDGNGNYMPNGTMTRAQFSAIVNRILRYTDESEDISKYRDVSASAWYRADLAKALAAAYLSGTSADTMSPEASITREQTFVILARILKLDTTDTSALDAYADAADVSDWAKGSVAALIKAGYVSGDDSKKINPKKALTRAEGVTVLNRSKTALDEHKVITKGVYKDGVYTGTGAGYGGTMKLQVTIKDGKISDIQILSQSETGSYLERAKTLLDKIKDNNGTSGVNAVSGATRSSNGIFDAVNACLSQAEGGKDTSTTGATGGGHGPSGNVTKPKDDNAGAVSLPDGVYEGSAEGYGSGVTVKVTFKGGKITDIAVTNVGETSSYYKRAVENNAGTSGKTIVQQIKDKNSADGIDTVSGATYSSYAIINAVKNAISKGAENAAVTYEVSSWAEFNNALAKANDGDTVKLTDNITDAGKGAAATSEQKVKDSDVDVVSSATATVKKNITIDGNGKTISRYDGQVIKTEENKDGSLAYSVVNSNFCFLMKEANITVKDLTVDGASFSDKLGGAVYIEKDAAVSMDGVTFENCVARSTAAGNSGGAIYVEPHKGSSPTLTAKNCVFKNNMVNNGTTGRGGAVGGYNANIVLENCTFSGNKAGYGGAVAAAGSSNLTVKGCTFEADNDGAYGGNDIYIFDGYTFYKKTITADSSVNYSISENTHKGTEDSDWKEYNVVIGRVLGEVSDITNAGSAESPKTGTYSGSGNSVFTAGHDLTFAKSDYDRKNGPVKAADASQYRTVMMNIPYADFYASELEGNDVKVDAVTSATASKWKATTGLAKGSYNDGGASAAGGNGGKILGVTMPVMVPANYTGDAELTVNNDYCISDYEGTPDYYKVMTVDENGKKSFSRTYGITTALADVKMTFSSSSRYGDYQLNFSGLPSEITVYGVVVSAADKSTDEKGKTSFVNAIDYGMRHLENIWRSGMEVSWSSGIKITESHGNTLSADHYKSMMGKYITGVKFITDKGIYTVSAGSTGTDGIYVHVKFTGAELSAVNADINAGTAAVTLTGLPEDYQPEYTITGPTGEALEGFSCDGEKVTWSGTATLGQYTLTVTDGGSKYDSMSTSFELTTDAQAAQLDSSALRLVATEGTDDETLKTYIKNIKNVNVKAAGEEEGKDYSASGKGAAKLFDENGFLDLNASGRDGKVFSNIAADAEYTLTITATGYANPLECKLVIPETIYAYAALSYAEYWENEGVQAAGNTASSSELDSKNESDKGAFDAVTRATTNHGLHRGNYQQTADLYVEGSSTPLFTIAYWKDSSTFVATDGTEVAYNRGNMTYYVRQGKSSVEKTAKLSHYEITGIKYVPVAIPAYLYAEFCKDYTVTQNGDTMAGGFSENKLEAYEYTAYVTADTNGLKTVSKSGGSWSFSARRTGSGSGILDQDALKVTEGATPEVKTSPGSYGEFLRMDVNGNYGGLGAAMQTVRWDYYGNGDTVKASYGTKFAADNWMHKSMGIQLGLTKSLRCQLPEGTDGKGKWVVTIYGLGYEDYSVEINVTDENLNVNPMDDEQVTQLTALKDRVKAVIENVADFDSKTGKATAREGADKVDGQDVLIKHYNEAVDMIKDKAKTTHTAASDLIADITDLLSQYEPKPEATTSLQDAEVTSETPSSVSEVLTTVGKTVNEKASENAENVSEDAEKSDAPATEAAPAATEENASAGQAEEAHASGVSAE